MAMHKFQISSLNMTLAVNMKKRRLALGLSQEALAEACGLHRTYVGSVERAERNVTLGTLELLANALEVPAPQLIESSSSIRKKGRTKIR
jgi:transcriptional regulator with XRE-family HTH domain